MKIALVADTFPPLRTSGAVQLRDLTREFVQQGHQITVMLPDASLRSACRLEEFEGAQVLRLRTMRTKDVNYVRRTVNEVLMPFAMIRNLRKSSLANAKWDGVVWYSPSIFHGPLVKKLKAQSRCGGYLVLRDIFPEWAVDMGLMARGLPFRFFRSMARYQYSLANTIGVQTPGNEVFFNDWKQRPGRQLEVLQNWLAAPANVPCSIDLGATKLAGRKIFVYAGNMGVAQDVRALVDLAERLRNRSDIGFLFVGRGSDADKLSAHARDRRLDNVLFHDEIHPDEIPALYAQCHVGLVVLDLRHKTHNIPGKFLTYMQSGLPVLARINAGNDLSEIIRKEMVGRVSEDDSLDNLESCALDLVEHLDSDHDIKHRCKNLYRRKFTPESAVRQIVTALAMCKAPLQ